MNTLKTCLVLGSGALAGGVTGVTAYAAAGIEIAEMNKGEFRKVLSRRVDQGDDSKVLESLEKLNGQVKSDFRGANRMAIGVGLASGALVSATLAASIPGDRGLDQEEVRPVYAAVRQQLGHPPNPNPLDPHTDHQERKNKLER